MGHADFGVRVAGRATFLLASGGEKLETTSTVQEVVYLSLGSNVGDRSCEFGLQPSPACEAWVR